MICNFCGATLKEIPAGVSKKTGKPYKAFTACPSGCKQDKPFVPEKKDDGMDFVLDELRNVNRRLDKMVEFLVEKLGSEKKDEININDIPFR